MQFQEQKKRMSVQHVYWHLRKVYGGKEAEEILDGLEGYPEEYNRLVDMIEAGQVEKELDQ